MDVPTLQLDDPAKLDEMARRAATVFAAGGLVVFPTETVYGIGASALSDKGYAALQAFKDRPDVQPFSIHLPTPAAAERYIDVSNPMLARLVRKVFPGPVTLVVDVAEAVISDRLRSFELGGADEAGDLQSRQVLRQRLYHGTTIGLRCPDDPVAQRVLGAIDAPIVAASANRRGDPPPMDADEAAAAVGEAADLIVDGGRTRYAKPSTIVRVTEQDGSPHIVVQRDGVYDERFIRKLLRWTMVVVCSGNTCRSPMAEAIAKDVLAKQRGIAADDLEAAGLRIVSAGVYAAPGSPAAPEGVEALAKMGIDLRSHRSRRLSLELIHEADVIYCMTRNHLDAIVQAAPSAAGKTFLLDPNGDIEDPIGSGLTTYQRCAEVIRRRLDQRLKEQQP